MEKEMDSIGMTDEKERRSYSQFQMGTSRSFLRAANMRSPASPGHFLREFGQSDRETIENANNGASVPQALMMLNGNTFNYVTNAQSTLSRSYRQEESPQDKLNAIFTSIYSRPPSDLELDTILSSLEQRGDQIYADTIFAMINSPEFLFVQ